MPIICKLCGKGMEYINYGHLKYKHNGMTTSEYREMFPNTPTMSPELTQKIKNQAKERWENPEYRIKNIKATQEAHRTPKYRALISKINKERCDDPEVKAKMSKRQKELWEDPEFRQKTTEAIIENHTTEEHKAKIQAFWTPEKRATAGEQSSAAWNKPGARERRGAIVKRLWQNEDWANEQVRKIGQGQHRRPTKPEIILLQLLGRLRLGYIYVGDGTFYIGRKNPDFICFERKTIIEHYGDYWHSEDQIEPRSEYFARYGFHTLIIWEHELNDIEQLLTKLKKFHHGIKLIE